jgi:L-ascorbate metabolism protein UlaG (beta-lactamase superfamily)
MNITWLGQGGFLIELPGARLAVDPYLSDSLACKGLARLVAPPCSPQALRPSMVVCTHDHDDHFDPATIGPIAASQTDCQFAGSASVIRHALQMGIDSQRCRQLQWFECISHGPAVLCAAPAEHDGDAIGLVVEHAGRRIYVSGDSVYFDELARGIVKAAGSPLDLVLICINGRAGNMTWRQAVDVVCAVGPRAAVPMHYGMFASNTADPAPFVEAVRAAGIGATTLQVGVPMDLEALLDRANR